MQHSICAPQYILNIIQKAPLAYIPFEKHDFFGKKILYAGGRQLFDSMLILGDPETWDFVAVYGFQDEIIAVSATPSRQKEFQVFREAFRLQSAPQLMPLAKEEWNIPLIYKLIRKLDKSGCYKEIIRQQDPSANYSEVIWMQRDKGSFVEKAGMQEDESSVELDERGYVTEL